MINIASYITSAITTPSCKKSYLSIQYPKDLRRHRRIDTGILLIGALEACKEQKVPGQYYCNIHFFSAPTADGINKALLKSTCRTGMNCITITVNRSDAYIL